MATRDSFLSRSRPWPVLRLLLAIAVMVLTGLFALRVLSRYFVTSEVALPSVVGRSSEEAQAILERLGLAVNVVPSPVSDAPVNSVISQSPQAGFIVREGRNILLEVSAPSTIELPSLVGATENEARNILDELTLEPGTVSYEFHVEVPEGQILSQLPSYGTQVSVPSNVDLVISRGPNVPTITMPDVRGQNIDAAKNRLRGLGFTVVDPVPSSVSNDAPQTVTQQSPAPGQKVTVSTRVTLGYSLSGQYIRQVPNLVGLSLANAQTALQSAGLVVGPMTFVTEPDKPQGVLTYAPSRYTLPGSPIMLTINGAPQSLPPSLSGTIPPGTTPPRTTQPGTQSGVVQQGPPVPIGENATPPRTGSIIPTPLPSSAPQADGSRDVPFSFDPSSVGSSQVMQQSYNLKVIVKDERGEREVLNRPVNAGEAVSASVKVYGEAKLETYINDLLYGAYNP
ncbi:MAG: PASTA domain-containing protein [Trueperaceae bacterium]